MLIVLLILLLVIIILGCVIIANRRRLKCQTRRLVFRPNPPVFLGDPLELRQVVGGGLCHSLRLTWLTDDGHLSRGVTVPLGQSLIQIQVILGGLSHGLCVLRFVTAQRRIEARLVGHILDSANLLAGIDVGEGAPNNAGTVGDFTVRAINVALESSCRVGKLVRVRRWRRSSGGVLGDDVRDIGDRKSGQGELKERKRVKERNLN